MHFIVFPVSLILATIIPFVCSDTLNVVLDKIAFIAVAVSPSEDTLTLLDARFVKALEFTIVRPPFNTLAVLCVIFPMTPIKRAILVEVEAKAVSFVILPLTLVDVSILMEQSAKDVGLIVLPVAFVQAAIGPDLNSTPLSYAHIFTGAPLPDIA